jgi:RNA polymerase sigma factor (sigma-70 family)
MDAEARFRSLFADAYPAIVRYARHRGLSRVDAEDLVAAVLEVAWRRIDDVPRDDPLPWLYAVARNMWRNELRATERRAKVVRRLVLNRPQDEPMVTAHDRSAIVDALSRLGEDDQEILRLVAWDELTPSQAAVVLDCSDVAARTRLHRARRRLARELAALQSPVTRRTSATEIHRLVPRPTEGNIDA